MSRGEKSWPPPPHKPDDQDAQSAQGKPRIAVWLQVLLGVVAGIAFALALQFGEFVLGYGRSVAVALLPLGLGLLIAVGLAARGWPRHRAFAAAFLVPVLVVVAVDVVEAIAIVARRGGYVSGF